MLPDLLAAAALLLGGAPVEDAKSSLRALEKRYGVDIQWEFEFKEIREGWTVSTRKPLEEDLVDFAPKLETAMTLYPDKLWKSGKITTIVLAKECIRNGVGWGGFAVHSRKALLLDVSKSANDDWSRKAFHHEVFHLLDPIADKDWSALNPEKFAYRPVSAPGAVDKTSTQAGFVSAYSHTEAREDKAEVFSYMVGNPKLVSDQLKRDNLLRGKVERMKTATATYGLDATWWKKRGF